MILRMFDSSIFPKLYLMMFLYYTKFSWNQYKVIADFELILNLTFFIFTHSPFVNKSIFRMLTLS